MLYYKDKILQSVTNPPVDRKDHEGRCKGSILVES